jgi:hypothetical protein
MQAFPHSSALPRTRSARPRKRLLTLAWFERASRVIARAALVLLMAVGSLALWAGSPLAWLWLASHVADSPTPGMGPYILLFAGVILTSVVLGRMLAGLDRAYRSLSGEPTRRLHHAVLRASGQERLERPQAGPLGAVMTISVILALIALATVILVTGQPFVPIPV